MPFLIMEEKMEMEKSFFNEVKAGGFSDGRSQGGIIPIIIAM